jgi:ribonuclease PH
MLPRATHTRSDRESVKGKVGGRTHEISRLVGRSLRAAIDLELLGESTIAVDCDVLQADGGTRTGGHHRRLPRAGRRLRLARAAPRRWSAASRDRVGIVDGTPVLDLDYPEDVSAGTDLNVGRPATGELIEVQGTAEGAPFSRASSTRCSTWRSAAPPSLTALQTGALEQPLSRHAGDPLKL